MDSQHSETCDRAVGILRRFDEVKAVGLAGSQAMDEADKYSDIDLQAVTSGRRPAVEDRKKVYESVAGIELGPLDHPTTPEFQKPPLTVDIVVDWVTIDGVKCDFLWLSQPCVETLLEAVANDPDNPETIAGWTQGVQAVFDPTGLLERFRSRCPQYTAERGLHKARNCLGYARWFMCDWRALEKCVFRKDVIGYQAGETDMVEQLITALYAVNRAWGHNRRRLRACSKPFTVLPGRFVDRIESMILRRGDCEDLAQCHRQLKMLFRDLAVAANGAYDGWDLPTEWSI